VLRGASQRTASIPFTVTTDTAGTSCRATAIALDTAAPEEGGGF
jgi:hypothetical protein